MIVVKINSIDISNKIDWESFIIKSVINNHVDTCNFNIINPLTKSVTIGFDDDIEVYEGTDKIFAGKVLKTTEESNSGGADYVLSVEAVDHGYEADRDFYSGVFENETIADILSTVVSAVTSGFTTNNVKSTFIIEKIVFNQLPLSKIIQRLADILQYNWYWDVDKDLHFFDKEANSAPFGLTDTNGNYVYKSLIRQSDGSQVISVVKVRGGEYEGSTFTDSITVSGNDSKSFKLPYKMSNLTIKLNTVSQTVGIDFIDDFTSFDVLHNYQDQSFRFENELTAGDVIEFTGNPAIRVFAGAEDPVTKAEFGTIEKLIRDDSIRSNTVARQRAAAELYAFSSEIIDARFDTYTSGLRSGMSIVLESTKKNYDNKLLIKSISFIPKSPTEFKYSVECVSTKRFDLIDLLRKIIDPEPLDIDESEVAEELFLASEQINIVEEIDNITPFESDETISEIDESILLDPIDPANVEFVLAPYTPTGQTDTKRAGRLDVSMQVY